MPPFKLIIVNFQESPCHIQVGTLKSIFYASLNLELPIPEKRKQNKTKHSTKKPLPACYYHSEQAIQKRQMLLRKIAFAPQSIHPGTHTLAQ